MIAVLMSAVLSWALPGCQFPDYAFANARGGGAGATATPGGATSNTSDAGAGGDEAGAAGAEPTPEPPVPCDPMQACVPAAPSDWFGPIAFWEGKAGNPSDLPDCPPGYGRPRDLHRSLNAPPLSCDCTCSAEGQTCDENTTLQIYSDLMCESPCATLSPKACSAVSNCTGSQGSLKAAVPTPSGGTCAAHVSPKTDPTWDYDSRICQPNSAAQCDDPNLTCAPVPQLPYTTARCVAQVVMDGQAPPDCPSDYPKGHTVLYDDFTDGRGCTDCGCGSVSGGSCKGSTLTLSVDTECGGTVAPYTVGSPCTQFNLGSGNVHPTSVGGTYTVTAGTCDVATPATPTGSATASGNFTVVCCK